MSTTITCPQCAATLHIPDGMLGKVGRCPRCKTSIPLTPPVEEVVLATEAEEPPAGQGEGVLRADDLPPAPSLSDDGPVPRKRKRKKKKVGLLERMGLPPIAVDDRIIRGGGAIGCLGLLGLFGFLVVYAALRTPPPPEIPESEWQTCEVEGRFKILLPGTPTRKQESAAGMRMILYMAQPGKDSLFSVTYSDSPLPPHRRALPVETLLNDSCDGAVANAAKMGGAELKRESIQLGPHPGKQLIIGVSRANGKLITRCYVVGGRLYMVMCGGTGFEAGQKNVQRLFDSFEILDPGTEPTAPAVKAPAVATLPPARPPVRPPRSPRARPTPEAKPPAPLPGLLGEIRLPADAGTVLAVGYSADGRTLAVGTQRGQALWYDANTRQLLASTSSARSGRRDPVGCAIAPQADRVAFHSHGGLLYLFERAAPNEAVILNPDQSAGISQWKAAFSPDGKYLCTTHGDQVARVWDVAGRTLAHELKGFQGQVGSAAYAPDGKLLACADQEVSLWDPQTHQQVTKLPDVQRFFFSSLAFTPDGKTLAGARDRTVYLWALDRAADEAKTPAKPRPVHHFGRVRAVAFSLDGRLLVSATEDGLLRVLDAQTLARRAELKLGAGGSASGLALRPASKELAVGVGSWLRFFDLEKLKPE